VLLAWLDRLLAWQVDATRATFGALADDAFRGLHITDAEVELLYGDRVPPSHELAARYQQLVQERAVINAHLHAPTSSLGAVARRFGLSGLELNVLLLALAPELDLRYERLYGYIQNDVTRKRPSVDLALRLFCPPPAERLVARALFAPDSPLLQHHLLTLSDEGAHAPLLTRALQIDERVVAELIGRPRLDPAIASQLSLARRDRTLDDLALPAEMVAWLRAMLSQRQRRLVLALQGAAGSGRLALAAALCAEAGVELLIAHLDTLMDREMPGAGTSPAPAEQIARVVREAELRGAAVFWRGASRLMDNHTPSVWRAALVAQLESGRGWQFLPLDLGRAPRATGLLPHDALVVEAGSPGYVERERLWRERVSPDEADDRALEALASTFRLNPGQIRNAVALARSHGPITVEALYAACRAQSDGALATLASKMPITYSWDDIVLPADQIAQLREVCAQLRHRRTVLGRWGFDRRLAMGKGVNILVAGPSGTGKTMAAEIIAADLGLDLYRIDLSTMVSKYIGETEKNLDKVFNAAREANVVLFFDEADAIFGKRSEVKDAHDRYANVETGYLLQKIEAYDGVVVLATNLRKNLDDAFVRRLHMVIEFALPEEPDRLRIWRKVFPPEAPLGADVDLAFLARQFKLAGGNIRNIALLAAYLAAEDNTEIGMSHVVRALKREYQKLGRLVTESEFGTYLALLRAERATERLQ
jgi:ATP-dependent 26S proteasome regulatory subunit